MSQLFSKTLRENPSYADSKGYGHLLRGGFIRQLGAGVYSALPLGFRSLKKIEGILIDEMDGIGAQQIEMPVIVPADTWKETRRFYEVGDELTRFKDRVGRDMVLSMTHEEVATSLGRSEINSYKDLPQLVYQIQTKWRDDPRPRAGLIRVREFRMKDSYSFDRDQEGLEKVYQEHYDAYLRIFKKCGLPVVVVGSDTGIMGGKVAHEYMYLSPIGEDTIIKCTSCSYIANKQVAAFMRNEPKAIAADTSELREVATPDCTSIADLSALLGVALETCAKMVFFVGSFIEDTEQYEALVVGVVAGNLDVEEAKIKQAVKALELRPAHDEEIAAAGMLAGYASLIGIKGQDKLKVVVDTSIALNKDQAWVAGANKAGYHYTGALYGRDFGGDAADIASAFAGAACVDCGAALEVHRGVETGNIFQLGTRYSEAMGCMYQDEVGALKPVVMGSYGIGVGRLFACLAEEYGDEKTLVLPISVAPFEVELVSLVKDAAPADELYAELQADGMDVLYDDRKASAGVKFNDADLFGIPIRITLGNRGLKEGTVELKIGRGESQSIAREDIVDVVRKEIASLYAALEA